MPGAGIWLGLTNATVENGCLRVVPVRTAWASCRTNRENQHDLANLGISGPGPGSVAGRERDLLEPAQLAERLDAPFDVVMEAGEMSFTIRSRCTAQIRTRPRHPDRAVGNVLHAWTSHERRPRRPGAGELSAPSQGSPFEQAGESPA